MIYHVPTKFKELVKVALNRENVIFTCWPSENPDQTVFATEGYDKDKEWKIMDKYFIQEVHEL